MHQKGHREAIYTCSETLLRFGLALLMALKFGPEIQDKQPVHAQRCLHILSSLHMLRDAFISSTP